MAFDTIGTPLLWVGFVLFVLAMLALDLGVFHRRVHEIRMREAIAWTALWVALALIFNLGIYYWFGSDRALEFLSGYLIEKALSVDNIFVFLVIFSYFAVPVRLQHRVLFWGILGALIMRGIFIVAGTVLLETIHWVTYVFGAFLVLTGIKLLRNTEAQVHPERNPLFIAFRRFVPSVSDYQGSSFTTVKRGKRFATPLLLVLVCVEGTDIAFSVDSIPAIFGISRDPFIVYTSNIFAILGLRALYFVLAGMIGKVYYLRPGLSFVLIFVGVKMTIADVYTIPTAASLAVIALVLGGAGVASLIRARRERARGITTEGAMPCAIEEDHTVQPKAV